MFKATHSIFLFTRKYAKFNMFKNLNLLSVRHIRDRIIWGANDSMDINFSEMDNINVQQQSTINMKLNEKPAAINYENNGNSLADIACNYFDEQYFTNYDCYGDNNLCSMYNLSKIHYETVLDNYSYPGKIGMNVYISISKNENDIENMDKKRLLTFPEKDIIQVNAVLPVEDDINYDDVIDADKSFPIYMAEEVRQNFNEEEKIVTNSFQWDGNMHGNKKWVYNYDYPFEDSEDSSLDNLQSADSSHELTSLEDPLHEIVEVTLHDAVIDDETLQDVIYSNLAEELEMVVNPYTEDKESE